MSESKTEAADAVTDKDAVEEVVDVEVVEVGARDNTPLALACVSLSLSLSPKAVFFLPGPTDGALRGGACTGAVRGRIATTAFCKRSVNLRAGASLARVEALQKAQLLCPLTAVCPPPPLPVRVKQIERRMTIALAKDDESDVLKEGELTKHGGE